MHSRRLDVARHRRTSLPGGVSQEESLRRHHHSPRRTQLRCRAPGLGPAAPPDAPDGSEDALRNPFDASPAVLWRRIRQMPQVPDAGSRFLRKLLASEMSIQPRVDVEEVAVVSGADSVGAGAESGRGEVFQRGGEADWDNSAACSGPSLVPAAGSLAWPSVPPSQLPDWPLVRQGSPGRRLARPPSRA